MKNKLRHDPLIRLEILNDRLDEIKKSNAHVSIELDMMEIKVDKLVKKIRAYDEKKGMEARKELVKKSKCKRQRRRV